MNSESGLEGSTPDSEKSSLSSAAERRRVKAPATTSAPANRDTKPMERTVSDSEITVFLHQLPDLLHQYPAEAYGTFSRRSRVVVQNRERVRQHLFRIRITDRKMFDRDFVFVFRPHNRIADRMWIKIVLGNLVRVFGVVPPRPSAPYRAKLPR